MKRYKRIQIEEIRGINKRTVLGHWETNLIEGKTNTALKVFMKRKTRFVKIIKVINKTGDKSINATMKVFEYGDFHYI